jgi:hypothetical protein
MGAAGNWAQRGIGRGRELSAGGNWVQVAGFFTFTKPV